MKDNMIVQFSSGDIKLALWKNTTPNNEYINVTIKKQSCYKHRQHFWDSFAPNDLEDIKQCIVKFENFKKSILEKIITNKEI